MLSPLSKITEEHKKAKLVIFDLDGTLTPSKGEMDPEMTSLIKKLLEQKKIAVIGGGKYEKFQEQLLTKLDVPEDLLKKLFLFPADASVFYRYSDSRWEQVYSYRLSEEEKKQIFTAFDTTFKELNYSHPEKTFGTLIEDRGTEVTFSALGQEAPLELKEQWKKEHTQDKLNIAEILQKNLPEFKVQAAGYTSIDVTRKGIDKEFGIQQINKQLGIPFSEMIFVGDAIFPGGNDYPALLTGVPCFSVKDPEETKELIRLLLNNLVHV